MRIAPNRRGNIGWITLVAALGGALGATYNLINRQLNRWRYSLQNRLTSSSRKRAILQNIEVLVLSAATFSLYYLLPAAFGCTPRGRMLAASSDDSTHGGGHDRSSIGCSTAAWTV